MFLVIHSKIKEQNSLFFGIYFTLHPRFVLFSNGRERANRLSKTRKLSRGKSPFFLVLRRVKTPQPSVMVLLDGYGDAPSSFSLL